MDFSSLKKSKNLLAFSGGGDSTALFFLLLENDISFDLAHVNYNTRNTSLDEAVYAQELAKKYNKKCFLHSVELEGKNFEAEARKERYTFFEGVINTNSYDTLLTAHHLNDKLEWFLMQLSKGAGLPELLGMQEFEERGSFRVVRPLLTTSKKELLNYLQERDIKWFEDESNLDEKYQRNYFRHNISNELLEKFEGGIKKSFSYLQEDSSELLDLQELHHEGRLSYFQTPSNRRSTIFLIDKVLKQRGYLMSASEREYLQLHDEAELSRRFLVAITDRFTFIVEGKDEVVMDKKFKELCRVKKVPKILRAYFFTHQKNKLSLQLFYGFKENGSCSSNFSKFLI